jgi:hypothetical protein
LLAGNVAIIYIYFPDNLIFVAVWCRASMAERQPRNLDPGAVNGTVEKSQLAMAQSTVLRQAFHHRASHRNDIGEWRALEDVTASLLERHLGGVHDRKTHRFAQAERRLKYEVSAMLRYMAPRSNRARHFRRAAENLSANAEKWAGVLGDAQAAYWRYAALVWMALWHVADKQSITAEQAGKCLQDAFKAGPVLNASAGEKAPRWYKALGRFIASLFKRT